MKKYEPLNILLFTKKLADTSASEQEVKEQLKATAEEWELDEKELRTLYEEMVMLSEEIEAIGGMEKYRLSNISWLKSELELLVECCQFCNHGGMRLTDVFYEISNEQANILPKTPSQITYMYYQIKKHNQPMERILRKKVGRKKKTDEIVLSRNQREKKGREKRANKPKADNSENGFMRLLSGTMNNLVAIYQNQEKSNSSLYHLIEEIYHLSSIGGQSSERTKEYEKMKIETESLRHQQESLIHEKEHIVKTFRTLVDCVQKFIDSPEMMQIITMPKFINESREVLDKLERIIPEEKDGK